MKGEGLILPPPSIPLPPTPRDMVNEGLPRLPTAEDVMPKPEELFASKGEVIKQTKDFVVEMTPKPKDIASAASELATGRPSEKINTVAMVLTPVAIIGGAVIVTLGLIVGVGAAGAAGAGGKGLQLPQLPALPNIAG